ncbi:MAG: hypothetical protein L6Q59_11845 [Ignavibacteriaceae bacterium]|nr:hypothetical protein [Ignavibacteriaceae bacterium]
MKNDMFGRYFDGGMTEKEKAEFEKLIAFDESVKRDYEKFAASMQLIRSASQLTADEAYLSEALVRARTKIQAKKEKKLNFIFRPAYSLTMVSVMLTLLLVYTSSNNRIIRNELSNSVSESLQVENMQKELLLSEESVSTENLAESLNDNDVKKLDTEIKDKLGIEKNEVVIAKAYDIDVKELAEEVSADELDNILEKLDKEFEL